MKSLQPHHYAWIMAHPARSTEWLRQMLKEGFHIHHLDGDHGNDAPNNLVLIEGADHFRLHGGDLPYIGRVKVKFRPRPRTAKQIENRITKKETKKLEREAAYRVKLDAIIKERMAGLEAKQLAKEEQEWTY